MAGLPRGIAERTAPRYLNPEAHRTGIRSGRWGAGRPLGLTAPSEGAEAIIADNCRLSVYQTRSQLMGHSHGIRSPGLCFRVTRSPVGGLRGLLDGGGRERARAGTFRHVARDAV